MEQPQAAAPAAPQGDAINKVTLAIRKVLYTQPTSDKIVDMLHSSQRPADALAMVAGFVAKLLMKESKNSIPHEVLPQMMQTLINELAEMASAIGMKVSDQDKQKALMLIVQAGQHIMQRAQRPQQPAQPAMAQPAAPPPPQAPPSPQGLIGSRVAA